jgi:hypothetical protein
LRFIKLIKSFLLLLYNIIQQKINLWA